MKQKTFLKWAGGKYRCLEHILNALPQAQRLIEPFTGSGVIFLNTEYPQYLLAEGNADLVNLFVTLQRNREAFINQCARYFCADNNTAEQYYGLRDTFNHCKNKQQRAALFLYLNRHGYNGLCRYNASGGYNVPFGHYTKPYFPRAELQAFLAKQGCTKIIHADFKETFMQAQLGDVIYCDPPYSPRVQTSNFTAYTSRRFGLKEHVELAQLAKQTAARGIPVVISNHDTPFTREQYQGSHISSFDVKRSISCKGKQRHAVRELIAVFPAR
jgi:DNA adenine methylase